MDKKVKENIVCFFLSFLTSTSMCIFNDVYIPSETILHNFHGKWDVFFWELNSSLNQSSYLICMVGMSLFFAFKYLIPVFQKKNLKWYIPLGSIFSFTILLGLSYHKYYSWEAVFGSLSAIIMAFYKGIGITILFVFLLDWVQRKEFIVKDTCNFNNKKRIIKYAVLFFVMWIPYMIILFPGCANADTRDQIAQIIGNYDYCWTAKTIVLDNPEVIINNHHPVFYTAILAFFVKLGEFISSYNWSFEIYCILQNIILAFTLAYQTYYLEEVCDKKIMYKLSILFFGLNPMFPIWGMTIMKDVFYSVLLWWIIFFVYMILENRIKISKKNQIILGVLLLLWLLVRNNGVYICAIMIPLLTISLWKEREKLFRVVSVFLIIICVFQIIIQGFLFSCLQITSGSPREMLSVPFMQTARYLQEYGDEISSEEEETILNIFDTPNHSIRDIVAQYEKTPDRGDNVKGLYNKEADGQDLIKYLIFWFKSFFRAPLCYVQAVLCLDYSWFNIESRQDNIYYDGITDSKVSELLIGFENPSGLQEARNILYNAIKIVSKIPFTSWLFEFSFYTWFYYIGVVLLIVRKKKNELISILPIILNYFICFVGPVAYMRYAFPAVVCLPTLSMFVFGRRENKDEKSCNFDSVLQ